MPPSACTSAVRSADLEPEVVQGEDDRERAPRRFSRQPAERYIRCWKCTTSGRQRSRSAPKSASIRGTRQVSQSLVVEVVDELVHDDTRVRALVQREVRARDVLRARQHRDLVPSAGGGSASSAVELRPTRMLGRIQMTDEQDSHRAAEDSVRGTLER
jgi:hypothetical protein